MAKGGRRNLTPIAVEVRAAGRSFWLPEPSFRDIVTMQRAIKALDAEVADTADDEATLLVQLRGTSIIMAGAATREGETWASAFPDDDSLLNLRPSEVAAVMRVFEAFAAGSEVDGEAAEDTFRGGDR